jgi:2'-5' RNA ligase
MAPKPRAPRNVRYVLWFTPGGAVRARLRRLIERLASQHGTAAFVPHVTLLGGLAGRRDAVLAKAESLAHGIRPFVIQLTRADMHDYFFEALFIHARHSPAPVRANRLARSVFGKPGGRKFMPHLSLLYGDLPVAAKEAILDRIGRRFDLAFAVRHVELWAIRGGPKQWRRVKRIPLWGARNMKTA